MIAICEIFAKSNNYWLSINYVNTTLISTNWKKLADFYINTFDCKIIPPIRNQYGNWLDKGTGLKNAKLKGAHLQLPGYDSNGPTLEIYQYDTVNNQEPLLPNTRGFGHIAFEVEDVEYVVENLKKNGGKLFGEITKRRIEGVGEITFVYARDPDGNLIEIQNWK